MSVVLDASTVLAFLHDEPGSPVVSQALEGALVSSVNWSEVLQKALDRSVSVDGMQQEFVDLGVTFEPFTQDHAEIAAQLWSKTRSYGLSFADRACIALASTRNVPVLTADRAWGQLKLNVEIRMIR